MTLGELCPNCAARLEKKANKYFCAICELEWDEEKLSYANRGSILDDKNEFANHTKTEKMGESDSKEKERAKALTCPSCGGNFTVSDLTDNDEFVTCTQCGKVYLTADIYLNINKDKNKDKNRKEAEEKEAEYLKNERENIENERRKIEQERLRLEKERRIREAHERLDSIIGNQSGNTQNNNSTIRSNGNYSASSTSNSHYSKATYSTNMSNTGTKYCNKWVTLLLCYFGGFFGVHKFYEGNKKWGIIYLFTFGFFGYGWLFDLCKCFFKIVFSPTYYPKHIN